MQRLEVSGAVRHIYESLGVKRLNIYAVWEDAAASYLKVVDRDLCGGAEINCEQPQVSLCLRRYSNRTPVNTSQRYYRSVHSFLSKALLSLTSDGHEFTGQQRPCCHAVVLSRD